MLLGNVVIIVVTAFILNRAARRVREAPALKRIVAVER